MNPDNKNKRVEYARQISDVARADYHFTISDYIKPITDDDDMPYLNVFTANSIYIASIFNISKKSSVLAYIPIKDIAGIITRTQLASEEIFRTVNRNEPASISYSDENSHPAFTYRMRMGNMRGSTPAEILMNEGDNGYKKLLAQANFLKGNVDKYPNNKTELDIILSSLNLYKNGKIPRNDGNSQAQGASNEAPMTYKIYTPPTKFMSNKRDEEGRTLCYEISVKCCPTEQMPYIIEIKNFYAPLAKPNGNSKLTPILFKQAVGKKKERICITEDEWLNAVRKMDMNLTSYHMAIYRAMRKLDSYNRYHGDNNCPH